MPDAPMPVGTRVLCAERGPGTVRMLHATRLLPSLCWSDAPMVMDMMQVVIRVECSSCKAEPGELCRTSGATLLSPSKSHLARVRAYHLTAHERWSESRGA